MRNGLKSFFILILLIPLSKPCFTQEFSFRKTRWGMSIEEVKASEELEIASQEDNILGFRTNVIGKDVFLVYFFVNDQLVRARYVLAEQHSNDNDYLIDYKDFKEILNTKYGTPKQDETLWKNDLFKDDYSNWGMAVSVGHLVLYTNWITDDTEITNFLQGENYEISCIVEYVSKDLIELENKALEEKALENF